MANDDISDDDLAAMEAWATRNHGDRAWYDGAQRDASADDALRLLRALRKARIADDPLYDATDAAHPAWWRGHDHVSLRFAELVESLRADRAAAREERDAALADVNALRVRNREAASLLDDVRAKYVELASRLASHSGDDRIGYDALDAMDVYTSLAPKGPWESNAGMLKTASNVRNADEVQLAIGDHDAMDFAARARTDFPRVIDALLAERLEVASMGSRLADIREAYERSQASLAELSEMHGALGAENDALKAKLAAWEPAVMLDAIRRGPVMGSPFICRGCNESRTYTGEFCACGYCVGCKGCVCPKACPHCHRDGPLLPCGACEECCTCAAGR